MKKSAINKLKLDKHTIRHLSRNDMKIVGGGISSESNFNTCENHCGNTIVFGCTATSGAE